jgi:malonyl CoA-acyl carrier protein transacylase
MLKDGDQTRAITCVKFLDAIPAAVDDLVELVGSAKTAVFYTIWSYASGAGRELIVRAQESIKADFPDIDVANYNSYEQTVLAGPIATLDRIEAALNAAGARAVVRLNVSAAFHSRAMRSAAEAFGRTLSAFSFRPLSLPVISNRKAFAYRDDELAAELKAQIMSPVRWVESIEYMLRMGVREFVEIGPGRSMSRLITDIRAATPFAN